MKTLLLSLFLFGAYVIAADKTIKVTVDGMVCDLCAQGINKRFKDEKEVKNLSVDFDEKTVDIVVQDGKDIPDARIKELISDSGFEVKTIKR